MLDLWFKTSILLSNSFAHFELTLNWMVSATDARKRALVSLLKLFAVVILSDKSLPRICTATFLVQNAAADVLARSVVQN